MENYILGFIGLAIFIYGVDRLKKALRAKCASTARCSCFKNELKLGCTCKGVHTKS